MKHTSITLTPTMLVTRPQWTQRIHIALDWIAADGAALHPYAKGQRRPSSPCARRTAGMTIIELLMATMIISLVTAAVAGMMMVVSTGTQDSGNVMDVVVRHKTLSARLGAEVRDAQAILVTDNASLLLWHEDANGDDAVNLSELRWITLDADAKELYCLRVAFPDHYTQEQIEAVDRAYLQGEDLVDLFGKLDVAGLVESSLWAQAVKAITFDAPQPLVGKRKLVVYDLTLEHGDPVIENDGVGAIALRN